MPDHLFSRRKRGSSGSWVGVPAARTARDYELPHQLPKPSQARVQSPFPRWDDAGARAADQDADDELDNRVLSLAGLVVGGAMIADIVAHPGELSAVLRATSRLAGQAIRDLSDG